MLTSRKTQNLEIIMYCQSSTGWMFSENLTSYPGIELLGQFYVRTK